MTEEEEERRQLCSRRVRHRPDMPSETGSGRRSNGVQTKHENGGEWKLRLIRRV